MWIELYDDYWEIPNYILNLIWIETNQTNQNSGFVKQQRGLFQHKSRVHHRARGIKATAHIRSKGSQWFFGISNGQLHKKHGEVKPSTSMGDGYAEGHGAHRGHWEHLHQLFVPCVKNGWIFRDSSGLDTIFISVPFYSIGSHKKYSLCRYSFLRFKNWFVDVCSIL